MTLKNLRGIKEVVVYCPSVDMNCRLSMQGSVGAP